MQLVVRVPGAALVLSRVAVDVLALVPVAHLELIRGSHAGPAAVGRSGEDAETKCQCLISRDQRWGWVV